MKVVILAGGFGTRLAEETDLRPKPMVEIGDRPILRPARRTHPSLDLLSALTVRGGYDPSSVACTAELKSRYFPSHPHWTVEADSALDREYLAGLGTFDCVYSWGVLHHSGRPWST
jgi:hypothetical protein